MATRTTRNGGLQARHIETMKHADVPRSGPALGGIGAGSIEVRKDGVFRNWTIFNNRPLFGGPVPPFQADETLFFMVRWEEPGRHPMMRLLQIQSDAPHPAGIQLQFYTFRWIRGVEETSFSVRWPFAALEFRDPAMPFTVEMEAFSPFIPHNVKDSALPAAFFHFTLKPKPGRKADALLIASMKHMAGYADPHRRYGVRDVRGDGFGGFSFHAEEMAEDDPTWGQMALVSLDPANTTRHLGWSHRHTFHEPLLHRRDLPGLDTVDGQNAENKELGRKVATYPCYGSLGWRTRTGGKGPAPSNTFALAWFFPNAYADATKKEKGAGAERERRLEGHYYANHFRDAGEVAAYAVGARARLERETRAFTDAFYAATLPAPVLRAVNAQLNTFVTSSWLTKAGDFGIQEGLTVEQAWGPLATIDVGMYGSIAVAALFPELDRATWEAHRRFQVESGDVGHGIARDFSRTDAAHEGVKSRVDLAPQFVIQAVRHYFLSNDGAWLKEFWPSIRKAADYTLNERDQDGDGLPEMAGSNSSYDNFPMFGPASYIASQWLSALAHARAAAEALGEAEDAARFTAALEKARARFEAKLWNGKYFSLFNDEGGAHGGHDDGCLSDQMIGQWANHITGLGDICARKKIDAALAHIAKRNLVPGEGLFNCRWPSDKWLHPVAESCWYDQANTFWTGVEYAFASFLAYEGRTREAVRLVEDVEKRYRDANLAWDHFEWGGHYFRPMSAWAILHGFLGLAWRGETAAFAPRLRDKRLLLLFPHPGGYGHFERRMAARAETVWLRSLAGEFTLKTLHLGLLARSPRKWRVRLGGRAITDFEVGGMKGMETVRLDFGERLLVAPGRALEITASA